MSVRDSNDERPVTWAEVDPLTVHPEWDQHGLKSVAVRLDPSTMPAGRDLDALIAEKVMGLRRLGRDVDLPDPRGPRRGAVVPELAERVVMADRAAECAWGIPD